MLVSSSAFGQPTSKFLRRYYLDENFNVTSPQMAGLSDTLLHRKVYLNSDNQLVFLDQRVLSFSRDFAKGFLKSLAEPVRHGKVWVIRDIGGTFSTGQCVDGKKEGEWLFYRIDGTLGGRALYVNDSIVQEACFIEKVGKTVRDSVCHKVPELTQSTDSLEKILNLYLSKKKINGNSTKMCGFYLSSEGEIIMESGSNEPDRFWKAVMHSWQYLKWKRPAMFMGVESDSWVLYRYTFTDSGKGGHTTVKIKLVRAFITANEDARPPEAMIIKLAKSSKQR